MGSCCSNTKIQPEKAKSNRLGQDSLVQLSSNIGPNNIPAPDKINNFVTVIGEQNKVNNKDNPEPNNKLTVAKIPPQKKQKNFSNYHKNVDNQLIVKKKGEVNGEQVIFDSCVNSVFIILDVLAQVTIEKCKDCSFYLGPCKSK